MTETEERQKRAMALLEYQETKQALTLLELEAHQLADDFEGLAKLLRSDPNAIVNSEGGKLPNLKEVQELAAKIVKVADDLERRRSVVQELGFTV